MPKFSFMIPTYNRADMLIEAIESCLSQDYKDFEVIISDNASTDHTSEVVKRYKKNSKVRYYRNPINIYGGPNWQKLVYEYASGEYVQLLPDDDLICDNSYLSTIAEFVELNRVRAVFSNFSYVDINESKKEGVRSLALPSVMQPEGWIKILGKYRNGNYVFPCMPTIYHLETARTMKVYYPIVPGYDFELILRFMLTGPTGYIDNVYCIGRAHESNASFLDAGETFFDGVKIFERFYEQGQKLGFNEYDLTNAKRRLMILYLHTFTLRAFLNEHGNSLRSMKTFYQRIKNIEPFVARQLFLNPRTIGKMLLFKCPKVKKEVGRLINFCDYH